MACQFCGASPSGDGCAIGCYTGANTIKRESFELWLVEWGESLQAIAAKQRRAEGQIALELLMVASEGEAGMQVFNAKNGFYVPIQITKSAFPTIAPMIK